MFVANSFHMLNKERAVQYLGFSDIPHLLIGIPVVAFFFPIVFFKADLSDGLIAYLPKFTVSLMYTTSYWLSIRELLFHMRLHYRTPEETPRRIIYTIIGILTIFFIVNSVVGFIHHDLLGPPFDSTMDDNGLTHSDYRLPSLTVIILVASIYEGIFFYQRWKEAIVETERLKRENVQSQLEGLKSQVNPHFLFNSLNTLIYIIPEDPDKAVTFVRKLSKVYRYILEIRDKELISVSEELAFLQSYIFLLKERFGESFEVSINVAPKYHPHKIVPLSLQMLLESTDREFLRPGRIERYAKSWALIHVLVRDSSPDKRRRFFESLRLAPAWDALSEAYAVEKVEEEWLTYMREYSSG